MGVIYKKGIAYGKNSGSPIPPSEPQSLPRLFVTAAAMPTTKDNVNCECEYEQNGIKTKLYGKIKCQGNTSMGYPKKNYTIKLYTDAERTQEYDHEFKSGWGKHSKYCLKANYVDHSHMRNIISGNIWKEIVESRPDYDDLPEGMKGAYNHGAVDGYPFKLYANGHYEGIYTWNIPKDTWMFNMDSDNPSNVALCAEVNSHGQTVATACNFKALWTGVDGEEWSIEAGENSPEIVTSVNNAIGFVINATDSEFISNINNYFDIDNIIDYYIFAYFTNALDNLGKNIMMITYDGTKWYFTPYDLDSTYGNFYSGRYTVPYNYACPQDYEEQYNHLFERVWDLFPLRLKARYEALRSTVLNMENIVIKSEKFNDTIGDALYKRDVAIYPDIPNPEGNNVWQIEDYMFARQAYVDEKFAALRERVACSSISVDSTMTIRSFDPVTLTVGLTPSDTTDRIFYSSSNNSVATISDYGVINAVSNGVATINIKCGTQTATCTVTVAAAQDDYSVRVETLIDNGGWSEMPSGTTSVLHATGSAIYLPQFGSTTINEVDVFMYDRLGASLGYKAVYPYNGQVIILDPDTYSINIHLYDPNTVYPSLTIVSGGIDLTDQVTSWTAGILDTTTGEITEDATSHTWFSDPITAPVMQTIATTCLGDAAYNYKGCVMYGDGSYIGVTGAEDSYKDDYTTNVSASPTTIRLTANDMSVDSTTSPSGKVRIFNFDRNINE